MFVVDGEEDELMHRWNGGCCTMREVVGRGFGV